MAHKPDIIENKHEKGRTLMDVAMPVDRNVVEKDAQKKN
jgi:hypothetical protein